MNPKCSDSTRQFQALYSKPSRTHSFQSVEAWMARALCSFPRVKSSAKVCLLCTGERIYTVRTRSHSGRSDGKTSHSIQGRSTLSQTQLRIHVLNHYRWGYLPFNGGPRVCLGQQFALTEIAYTVVRILQEFKAVESCDPSPWQENWMTSCSVFTGCQVSMIPYDDVSV